MLIMSTIEGSNPTNWWYNEVWINENLWLIKRKRKIANIQPSLQFYGIIYLVKIKPLSWGMAWLPFQKLLLFSDGEQISTSPHSFRRPKGSGDRCWIWRETCRRSGTQLFIASHRKINPLLIWIPYKSASVGIWITYFWFIPLPKLEVKSHFQSRFQLFGNSFNLID